MIGYSWFIHVFLEKLGFTFSHMKELCDWFTTMIIFNWWLLIGSATLLNVLFFFFGDHGTSKQRNGLIDCWHMTRKTRIYYILYILCWGVVFNYLAGSCRKFQSCPVLCLKRGHASIPFSLSPHMFPYLAPDISWFSSIIKNIINTYTIIWSQNSRLWWWFLMCPAIFSHLFPCVALPSGQWDTEP